MCSGPPLFCGEEVWGRGRWGAFGGGGAAPFLPWRWRDGREVDRISPGSGGLFRGCAPLLESQARSDWRGKGEGLFCRPPAGCLRRRAALALSPCGRGRTGSRLDGCGGEEGAAGDVPAGGLPIGPRVRGKAKSFAGAHAPLQQEGELCGQTRGDPFAGACALLQQGGGLYGRTRGAACGRACSPCFAALRGGCADTAYPLRRSHLWGRFLCGPAPPWRADCLSAQGRGLKFVQEFVGNPLQLPDNFYIIKIYNVCKKNVNSKKSPANLAGRGTSLKLR